MWLIITTNRGVRLIDTESWEENILVERKCCFYGVSWYKDHIYVVKDFQSKQPKICVLDEWFDEVGVLDMGNHLKKPHQIVVNNDKLWVADAGKDALVEYDFKSGAVSDHALPDTGGNFGSPLSKNHFNSLTFKDELLYVCAHNGTAPSTILILDRYLNEVNRFNMGSKTHNIALNKGITICNSADGTIEHGEKVYYKINGFTRGLAQTDEEIIFGVSVPAKRNRRSNGVKGARIGIIKNGSTKVSEMEGCSQVYDIRILDKFDYGHHVKPFL